MVNATHIFAPDEIPRIKGPAIGLLKNVCKRNPASESAPPKSADIKILGKRILHIMLYSVSPPSRKNIIEKISFTEISIDPELIFSIVISTNKNAIRTNTKTYLAFCLASEALINSICFVLSDIIFLLIKSMKLIHEL